jgi:hypothetical protein
MRLKFYINIGGICHNHNEAAAEGGGAPTPAPAPAPPATPGDAGSSTAVEPPAPAAVEPPAAPAVPDGYVPATEVETERTARTAAETARADAETRATTLAASLRAAQIREAARDLSFNDPADAEKFVGADVEDVGAHLAEVIKTKSYLVKSAEAPVIPPVTPTTPTNPARDNAPAVTRESLKQMTQEQVSKLPWSVVSAALKQT